MTGLTYSTKFTLLPLTAMVSAILLTACGGSFSNPSYIEAGFGSTTIPQPSKKDDNQSTPLAPPSQNDDAVVHPLFKPTLSAVMPIPKRKKAKDNKDVSYFGVHEPLTEEALKKNSQRTLADLEKELKDNYDKKVKDYYKNNFNENMSPSKKSQDGYQFVKTGWIFSYFYADKMLDKVDDGKEYLLRDGDGYVYYYAEQPTIGRTKGSAEYTGSWDFVTDAKYDRRQNGERPEQGPLGGGVTFGMDIYWGDDMGATSFAEQSFGQYSPREGNHQASFQANFDEKTLTGLLSSRKQQAKNSAWEVKNRYNIDAKIQGNRFFGSAKAVDKKTTLQFFQKDATNRLEGGFFGPNAEELGGRFLTDDNSVFAVFSGKQVNPQKLEIQYDGLYVDTTQDKQINPAQKATTHNIANFGNVNQLQIGSQLIELLPNDHSQKTVKLASGQTAVITSFGTTDGLLRLGSFSKTASSTNVSTAPKQPTKPRYSEAEIEKAKEKLLEVKESISEEVENDLYEYMDEPTPAKKQKIIKNVLSAFTNSEKTKATLEKLLSNFEYEHIEEILDLMKQGDKFDPSIETNWQVYLPERKIEPTYSQQVIDDAKTKLQQKINDEKEGLIELIEGYLVLLSESDISEEETDEHKQEIITKVLEAYSQNQHSKIKTQLENLLDKESDEEIEVSDNHEIVKLFVKGDKFNLEKLENLKEFLPKPDKNSKDETQTLIALDDSIRGFYLLGDRTPVDQIPTRGEAKYTGTWHGRIGNYWQSEAGKGEYASKANFDVNFADKKLTGTLTEKQGVEPAFKITADIQDNGFAGKVAIARETGIDLDPGQQQNKQILKTITNSNVQGGFYGENAKHLAGTFAFEGKLENKPDDTIVGGGVFYGTNDKASKEQK